MFTLNSTHDALKSAHETLKSAHEKARRDNESLIKQLQKESSKVEEWKKKYIEQKMIADNASKKQVHARFELHKLVDELTAVKDPNACTVDQLCVSIVEQVHEANSKAQMDIASLRKQNKKLQKKFDTVTTELETVRASLADTNKKYDAYMLVAQENFAHRLESAISKKRKIANVD